MFKSSSEHNPVNGLGLRDGLPVVRVVHAHLAVLDLHAADLVLDPAHLNDAAALDHRGGIRTLLHVIENEVD
jgi:hypothetical protein